MLTSLLAYHQGSHVGKIVLTPKATEYGSEGLTIVTGGTGGLGAHVAAWLAGHKVSRPWPYSLET